LNYFDKLTIFLIIVVLIEEIFKYIVLAKLYSLKTEQAPTISMAIFAGLGFSLVEIFFLNQTLLPDIAYFDFRSLSALALHVLSFGIIGTLLFRKDISALKIISFTFGLHLFYNLLVIYAINYLLIYAYLALITTIFTTLHLKSIKTNR
jgi:hypothetical protein